MKRKLIVSGVALLAFMQFFIPQKNKSEELSANDISEHYQIPDDVQKILKRSCYDCHSNNTTYPWYFYIQPVGFYLDGHIKHGKKHLNFSDFGKIPEREIAEYFEAIGKSVKDHWMPLKSYLWIHKEARLNTEETRKIHTWAFTLQKEVSASQ